MKYLRELEFLKAFTIDAWKKIGAKGPKDIEEKGHFDLVTEIDTGIEKYFIEKVNKAFPNDTIVSEETNYDKGLKERTWIIDPIDGTINYARGVKAFGIQTAFAVKGEPILSVIYMPSDDALFYAIKGEGAYLNNQKMEASEEKSFEDDIILMGDYSHHLNEEGERQYRLVGYLYPLVQKVRIFGCASFDFTTLARGSVDATIHFTSNIWDLVPGYVLNTELGLLSSNLEGKPYKPGDYGLIMARGEKLFNLIEDAIKK